MVTFNEETHTYTNEEGKKLISVTTLMRKHNLSPAYFGVDAEVLKKAAEKGTLVHAEIETFNKTREIGFTRECRQYVDFLDAKICEALASELMTYDDMIAGTLDLIVSYGTDNPVNVIADIKTTYEIHYEAISWQLSIYKYLVEKQCGDIYHLNQDYGQVFHFCQNGELEVVDIKLKPIEEVLRLFECERNGVLFVPAGLVDISSQLVLMEQFTMALEFLEQQQAELEAKKEVMKDQIMAAMKERNIYKFQNDDISIAYTPAKNGVTFDKDKFKEENPYLYEKYNTNPSARKESLRITVRKGAKKNNE